MAGRVNLSVLWNYRNDERAKAPNVAPLRACALRYIPGVLLLLHGVLLAIAAAIDSPTANEPGHLVAGVATWQLGRFDLYPVNPPLVRLIAAAPLHFVDAKTDWNHLQDESVRPEFGLG